MLFLQDTAGDVCICFVLFVPLLRRAPAWQAFAYVQFGDALLSLAAMHLLVGIGSLCDLLAISHAVLITVTPESFLGGLSLAACGACLHPRYTYVQYGDVFLSLAAM